MVLVVCPVHGRVETRGIVGGTGTFVSKSSISNCPICGRSSPIVDGTYILVDSVVQAFLETSATREQVSQFRDIAVALEQGHTTREEAEQLIAELGDVFLNLWKWLNANGTAVQTIIAVIGLFLMLYFQRESAADADKLQVATEKQFAVEQQIVSELRKQSVAVPEPIALPPPTPTTPLKTPPQMQVQATHPNRHDRRAAKAKNRRKPRN